MRIVVTQGPLHAVVAGAVASYAQRERADDNVLVIGGMEVVHEGGVVGATRACAAQGPWSDIVEVPAGKDPAARMDPSWDVTEIFVIRNWQPLNEQLLRAFPDARVTVYGDTLGVIDTDPAGPRVDRVTTVVPQPQSDAALRGVPVDVVPRASVTEAVRAARASVPGLVAYDAELAEWARGGVLALLANTTEAGGSTLRSEVTQGYELVRLSAAPGAPVVLKPHPRAELGQAAAIARRLRADGHPVRVMPAEPFGVYPIELFESLARSVATVQGGQSSAVLSLLYLYGVAASVEFPRALRLRTHFPYLWRWSFSILAHNRRVLELLPEWDGRSPLPVPRPSAPGLPERALGSLVGRVFAWNAPGAPGERRVPAPPPAPGGVHDERLSIAWAAPAGVASGLLDGLPDQPHDRVAATLERLRERSPGAPLTVTAHVRPPVNVPRWERRLTRDAPFTVADNAQLTAEELEDLLEAHVDVTERRPELTDRSLRRGAAPLRVEFAGRVRD